jgi:hypothetical protein
MSRVMLKKVWEPEVAASRLISPKVGINPNSSRQLKV